MAAYGVGIHNFETPQVSGELDFIRRLSHLQAAPTVFDIGAHKGDYTRLVKTHIPNSRVFAFEPHPETYRRLVHEVGTLCETFQLALSDSVSEATLFDRHPTTGTEHATLLPRIIDEVHGVRDVHQWSVATTTLDDFMLQHSIEHIQLLKIDTEGTEMQVLRGAKAALLKGSIDLIQVEFNSMNVFSRTFFADYRDLLHNYHPYRLLPDGLLPLVPYNPMLHEIFGFQNLLFVAAGMPDSERHMLTV